MRSRLLSLVAALALCCLSCNSDVSGTGATPPKGPQPKILFDTEEFVGPIEGGFVKHRFLVFNRGSAPLEISKVDANCGCTTAEAPNRMVAPGAMSYIDVEFHVAPDRPDSAVYVHSNDPEKPVAALSIAADRPVAPLNRLEFIPAWLRVASTKGGEQHLHCLLRLVALGRRPSLNFEKVKFDSSSAEITAKIGEVEKVAPEALLSWQVSGSSAQHTENMLVFEETGRVEAIVAIDVDLKVQPTAGSSRNYLIARMETPDGEQLVSTPLAILIGDNPD